MKRKLVRATLLAALLGAAACTASYSHTEINAISSGDLPTTISRQKIQVPVGAIAHAEIRPYNSDNNQMIGEVQSSDPSVLEVIPGIRNDTYAFIGRKAGKATVTLYAGGVAVGDIPADVVEQ